jgi:hypothetical protein
MRIGEGADRFPANGAVPSRYRRREGFGELRARRVGGRDGDGFDAGAAGVEAEPAIRIQGAVFWEMVVGMTKRITDH